MKSSIGIILIIGAVVLGYMGVTEIQNNSASLKVLGIELEAENKSGKQQGYIYLGLAVVLLGAGVVTVNKGKG